VRQHRSLNSPVMSSVLAALLSVMAVLIAAPAIAQTSARDTARLTFSEPVQIPDATLPAGEYVFTIADKSTARSVVQVWNEDETELMAQALIVPTRRLDNTGEIAIRFAETPRGVAPALRAWFVPGQNIGHEFVYPEDQARWIAETSKTLVLSSDHDAMVHDGYDTAVIYRVDRSGQHFDYTDAPSWDDAPLMDDQAMPVVPGQKPDMLIDQIEAIVDDALEADGTAPVALDRETLRTIQAHLDRLRAAIETSDGALQRHR